MYINQYKPDVHKSREYTDLKSTKQGDASLKIWGVKFAYIQEPRMCYHICNEHWNVLPHV